MSRLLPVVSISPNEERVQVLIGSVGGQAWQIGLRRMKDSVTLYVPFGCPDHGQQRGQPRNEKRCAFCALPQNYQLWVDFFNDGKDPSGEDFVDLFAATLENVKSKNPVVLKIFNAGSFLAMPGWVQLEMLKMVCAIESVEQIVVEARASLITSARVKPLADMVRAAGKTLQILIGIESQNDQFREEVLGKGHTRTALLAAAQVMRDNGVQSGAYVLFNPAPGLDLLWAKEEALATIRWVLGTGEGCLGFHEVQLNATCVPDAANNLLYKAWLEYKFSPASLSAVYGLLREAVALFPGQVVLGRFMDEPKFVAVPSNHSRRGFPEGSENLPGCDPWYHKVLQKYRNTMDPRVLDEEQPPSCDCHPDW